MKLQPIGKTGWAINFSDLPKDPTPVCEAIEHLLREAGKLVLELKPPVGDRAPDAQE